jgi:dATP pyrophosphohydrolase
MSCSNPCVGVSVIVVRRKDGEPQILFLRRSGGRFGGQWWPITGTREASEDPAHCAFRELEEETGLTPVALYRSKHTAPVEGGKGHLKAFIASVDSTATVQLNWEHDAYQWCSLETAREMVPSGSRGILGEAVRVFEAEPTEQEVTRARK